MITTEIAQTYIHRLSEGNTAGILVLFAKDATVRSPLYGELKAEQFYTMLANDTSNSNLNIKEIFENEKNKSIALYFNYEWTMRNGKIVDFDVVDIIKLNDEGLISSLHIIYDTVISRQFFDELNSSL